VNFRFIDRAAVDATERSARSKLKGIAVDTTAATGNAKKKIEEENFLERTKSVRKVF
jgi:hypothetical protein